MACLALDADMSNVKVPFWLDRAICDSIFQYFDALFKVNVIEQ